MCAETDPGHDGPTPINEPAPREDFEYWQRLPHPRADRFDPLDLRPHLGLLSIVETADRLEDFRTRLFGTVLVEEFQQERTGMRLGDLRDVENWEKVYAPYVTVRDSGRPHYQAERGVSFLRSYRGYARLLLPLESDDGAVTRIVAMFSFGERLSGAPD